MQEDSLLCRCGRGISALFAHLLMTCSWMILTFFVINIFNPSMAFLDSKISRGFELLYAGIAIVCAVSAFLRKSFYTEYPDSANAVTSLVQKLLRIFAVLTAIVAIVLAIPVIQAISQDSREPLITSFFQITCCVSGIITLLFSVMEMGLSHHQAKAAYKAATAESTDS